ncbi:MAG TPA: hypothetical protein VN771_05700 [Candidatus Baltobacteraceae bacterium]|nr:hypothetical protein [Candidatus Baltobacteraceae bacterium]
MHVRRGLLFWGFFLLPLGAIRLLARAGLFDMGVAADAVSLTRATATLDAPA